MKINNLLLVILFATIFSSCNQKQETINEVTISGKIENMADDLFLIKKMEAPRDSWDTTFIDHDGNFVLKLEVDTPEFYQFSHGNEVATMFLDAEYDLHLVLNTEEFDESLKYEGKGNEINNYIIQKFLIRERELNWQELLTKDTPEFFEIMKNVGDKLEQHLEKNIDPHEYIPASFAEKERIENKYDLATYRIAYLATKSSEQDGFIEPDQSHLEFIKEIDINDPAFQASRYFKSYLMYLSNYLTNIELQQDSTPDYSPYGRLMARKNVYQDLLKDKSIIEDLLFDDINKDMSYFVTLGKDEAMMNIINSFENEMHLSSLTESWMRWKSIGKGKDAPVFSCPDIDGNMHSLSDYKGKYVYIDVWATWCGPCIKEIPYLKELHDEFQDRNIVFISVSVDSDSDKPTWETMVKEENLKGIQLFAGHADEISDLYMIRTIPRFLLIDPAGKIIDNDAPRPSDEKINELFNSLKHL